MYDLFAVEGKGWSNHSLDYSFTHRNLHVYGEMAIDRQFKKALLNGLLMSLDAKADLAIVYWRMDKAYQSIQGNAFTENYLPGNEQGLYAGLSLRPAPAWQLDAYADCFRFPWLKYRVNAPGSGAEYLIQLLYKPNKTTELLTRYRHEHKPSNGLVEDFPLRPVVKALRQNWRSLLIFQPGEAITIKSRVELVWYQGGENAITEKGFSAFTEVFMHPGIPLPLICACNFLKPMDTMPGYMLTNRMFNTISPFPSLAARAYATILIISKIYLTCWFVSVPER